MTRWMQVVLGAVLAITTSAAMAVTEQGQKLDDATAVLRQFVDIPENAIPSALLRQAYGIAVIPGVIKLGFVVGGRYGKGVLSVRMANGRWSDPSFISLTGGSIGWQAGASSTDIILVFKTQRSVEKIANGQFSLGADASVAAGPVGRSAGASTNGNFSAEVYSYSRSRGLFAGVSVEGGRIAIASHDNGLFYNQAGLAASQILRDSSQADIPKPGQRFVYTLDRYMPPSNDQFRYGVETAANAGPNHHGGQQASRDDSAPGQATPYHGAVHRGVTVQRGVQTNTPHAHGANANAGRRGDKPRAKPGGGHTPGHAIFNGHGKNADRGGAAPRPAPQHQPGTGKKDYGSRASGLPRKPGAGGDSGDTRQGAGGGHDYGSGQQ